MKDKAIVAAIVLAFVYGTASGALLMLAGCQALQVVDDYTPYVIATLDESAELLDKLATTREGSDARTLTDCAKGVRAIRTAVAGIKAGGEYDPTAARAALREVADMLDDIAALSSDQDKLVLWPIAAGLRIAASRAGGLK